jgi:hypothetical protein
MFMRFDIFILGYRKLDMKMENIGSATSGASRPRNPLWGTGQEARGVGHVRGQADVGGTENWQGGARRWARLRPGKCWSMRSRPAGVGFTCGLHQNSS